MKMRGPEHASGSEAVTLVAARSCMAAWFEGGKFPIWNQQRTSLVPQRKFTNADVDLAGTRLARIPLSAIHRNRRPPRPARAAKQLHNPENNAMDWLLERAAACGIEAEYIDGLGRPRCADPRVVARLLTVMGDE